MPVTKLPTKLLLLISAIFGGCVTTPSPSKTKTLTHERLLIRDKGFIKPVGVISPTIPFPQERFSSPNEMDAKFLGTMGMATIGAIVPKVINKGLDIIGKAIVQASGKNTNETTISANASNFFFKDNSYNYFSSSTQPAFNLIFMSAQFGDNTLEKWQPRVHKSEIHNFKELNLSGEPNFYLEAKLFPLPGNEYMEIVPSYIFYNRPLNTNSSDKRRDLLIRFSFYDMNEEPISQAHILLKEIAYGHEYLDDDLAQTRTTFMQIPSINSQQIGYSGAFNLKVEVMETRDINQWLAAFGESLLESKEEIVNALPSLSKEAKIEAKMLYLQALKDVEIVKEQIRTAKEALQTKEDILLLEKTLIEKEAQRDKLRLAF